VPAQFLPNSTFVAGVGVSITAGTTRDGPGVGLQEPKARLYLPTLLR
jgi:hypothetical protein